MIDEVDRSLRALLCAEVPAPDPFELSFDAPDRAWAEASRPAVLDLHLYDVVEVVSRRPVDLEQVREEGRVVARSVGRRWYRLSYRLTAWAETADAEHRLLSLVLRCLVSNEVVPTSFLEGSLASTPVPVTVSVAAPRPEGAPRFEHSEADPRPAKAGLDVVVTAPLEPLSTIAVAEPPRERLIGLSVPRGATERRSSAPIVPAEATQVTRRWRTRKTAPR